MKVALGNKALPFPIAGITVVRLDAAVAKMLI